MGIGIREKHRCFHNAVENALVTKIRIKQTHNLKEPKSPQGLYYFICTRGTPQAQRTEHRKRGERAHPGGVTLLF